MFELYVGGEIIQYGNKLSDLTLLLTIDYRNMCPYNSWVISHNNTKIDVSRYDPNQKLKPMDIKYFDGKYNNIFRIQNGMGKKLFSIPKDLDSDFIKVWIIELKTQLIDDDEIANFVGNTKDIYFICCVLENSPREIIEKIIPILKLYYTIEEKEDGLKIIEHSWCLGEPMEIARKVKYF